MVAVWWCQVLRPWVTPRTSSPTTMTARTTWMGRRWCHGTRIRFGATLGAGSDVLDRTGGLLGVVLLLGDMDGGESTFPDVQRFGTASSRLSQNLSRTCVSA